LAIERGLAELGGKLALFLCGARWASPPGYLIVIEQQQPIDFTASALAAAIDRHLQLISVEYASKRESGRLASIEVIIAKKNEISKYVESLRVSTNTNQHKYKPFYKDISFVDGLFPGGLETV